MDIEIKNNNFNQIWSTDIGLSDILLSLHYLSPNSEITKKAIAKSLGFDLEHVEEKKTFELEESRIELSSAISDKTNESQNEHLPKKVEFESDANVITLKPQEEKEIESVDIFNVELDGIEALPPTKVELHFKKPKHLPLFDEKWFMSIMSLILSTPQQTSEIDFRLIEKTIFNFSPIERFPNLYRNSLHRGVQVMLDVSDMIQPYLRDKNELILALTRLLDKNRVKIFKFELETFPQKEIVFHYNSIKNIQDETPILIVSNFFSSNREKLVRLKKHAGLVTFFETVKNKKCPIAVLIPTSEEFFPEDIKEFVNCCYVWDRTTSPQTASRIKRNK